MQRTLPSVFPGPFHLHYCRSKGLITPALLAQVPYETLGSRDHGAS
jgi:hypothetical protein